MTSGNFASIDVSSIIVNREERQRKELRGIEELAESINRNGLIHPIVIDREHVLIAGERRYTAIKLLGWTSIPAQYADELDDLSRQILEYEENVRRADLTWQENCLAVEHYHALRKAQDPNQSQEDTGKELNISRNEVTSKIGVAKELRAGNELVMNADKYSTARNIVVRKAERQAATTKKAVDQVTTTVLGDLVTDEPPTKSQPPLLNEDFHEWAAAYCGQKFNMIHCDFPYGVGMQRSDQGAGQEFGTYEDEPDVYFKLLDTLEMAMDNVVADSAHLLFWFSMDFYSCTLDRLTDMGWRVNPFPLVWFKNDNTGIIPDAQRGPRRVYETAFFASRGDRKLTERGAKANAYAHPGRDKEIHMNEKPVPMLQHFMAMTVDEYSFVLDPTAGSANALKAAKALGASRVLGLERDPEFFSRAVEAWDE